MKQSRILNSAVALGAFVLGNTAIAPAQAGALGPGGGGSSVTMAQTNVVVQSGTQNQSNTAAYFSLPVIASVIRQTFTGAGALRQRTADGEPSFGQRGLAASADSGLPMQVWAQGSGGGSRNNLATGGYDFGNYGGAGGIQAEVVPSLIVGLSGSWQGSDGTLNGGFTSRSSTWGFSPYVGWQFDEHWSVSLITGLNASTTNLKNAGANYAARYRGNQWDIQGEVDGSYAVGPVRLSPTASMVYIETNSGSVVDNLGNRTPSSSTALTRGSLGGSVSMPLTGWEPYLRLSGEHDFKVPTGSAANGDSGATIGAGTTVTVTDAFWLTFDGGYNSLGRTGLSLWSVSARADLRF
jgi:hypothetical protein